MKKTIRKSLFMAAMFLIMCCAMLLPSTDVSAQVKLNTSNVTLSVGQSKTVKISGTSKKATWSTNKPKVATVNNKGKITAVGQGTATITAKVGSKKYKCKVLVYQASSGNAKVDKKVKAIIQKEIKANMSDAEKVKAIHDYIITHCEYDTAHKDKGVGVWHTAYGALVNGKAVCVGYADAFQICMEALGIPSQKIDGEVASAGHAWNLVQIDGNWYHIDLTFDDPVFKGMPVTGRIKSFVSYEYFLVSDKKMKNDGRKWHLEWLSQEPNEDIDEARKAIPKCTSSSDKFVKLIGNVVKNQKQIDEVLKKQEKAGLEWTVIIIPKKYYKESLITSHQHAALYKYGNYYMGILYS